MTTIKFIIFFCSNIFFVPESNAQINDRESFKLADTVYNEVDVEPEFKGGDIAWKRYLLKSFNLDSINERMTATELLGCKTYMLKFIVTIEGSITGIEFENKVSDVLKDEISRLLRESPKWIPASKNGKNVNAYQKQPISILIENE